MDLFKRQKLVHCTILAITIMVILLNYYMRQPLYYLGLEMIIAMQKNHSQLTRLFFQVVTMASQPVIVFVIFLVIMLGQSNKKHALNTTIFLLANVYLITLLKQLYHDPRPFWSSELIKSLSIYCPAEFGNPSGHSWFITVLSFLIFFRYVKSFSKISTIVIIGTIILLVAISRMFLGAHSLNQVVQGVLFGLVMNCLYYICHFDDFIKVFLEQFNGSQQLRWKNIMFILHILYVASYFITSSYVDDKNQNYKQIEANILAQCGKIHTPSHINFSMFIAASAIVNMITGLAMGYESMYDCQRGRKYLEGSWEINQQRYPLLIGTFLYYLVQILCLASGAVVGIIFMIFLPGLRGWPLFIVASVCSFLSGYIFTKKTAHYLYYFGIIIEIL